MSLARAEGFPRNFGAYLLLSSLGRGGMGEVFLAKKRAVKDIDRLCIVKTLRGDLAEHQEYVRRFLDEARIVVQLNHSNICQVYDAGRVGPDFFLAMEYIPGVNIKDLVGDLVQRSELLPPGLALWMGEQICEALGYAHRLKSPVSGEFLRVIHRDVSPANVMVSFEGEVKLIDFGLAESSLKTEQTETRLVMGKVAYMSPEQARGEEIDGTTDQFAAAVLTYEMLTGDRFYGDFNTHQVWQVVGTGTHVPRRWHTLDQRVRAVLGRALGPQLAARFPTCEALGAALEDVRAQIDPRASRNQLREVMRRLYADRAAAEHDVIASYADLRAPSAVDAFAPPPTQPGVGDGIEPSGAVDSTDQLPRARKGWEAGTEPWQNSPNESGGQPTSAQRRSPGEAVSAPLPELTARDAPARAGAPVSSDAATKKRTALTSLPPDMTMSSPSSPSNVARDTITISDQSAGASVVAQLPPNNLGRLLVGGAVALAVLVALFAFATRDDITRVAIVADAGISASPRIVDAGSVAVVSTVVDAGLQAETIVDAGAVVAHVDVKKPPRDTKTTKTPDTKVEPPPDAKVEPADVKLADAGTKADPSDVPVDAFTAYEVVDIIERCIGRVSCATQAARLPGFKDPAKAEAQRNGLKFCATSCVKAGVPRRR